MTKENGYIWITDEVDSSNFSMVAPRHKCHTKPKADCKCCGKKVKNKIVNEKIIQVAVAWGGSTAKNEFENEIEIEDKSGQKEINFCCNGGNGSSSVATKEQSLEVEEGVISKNYNLDTLEGDFSLKISKDGEVTINGLKAEE